MPKIKYAVFTWVFFTLFFSMNSVFAKEYIVTQIDREFRHNNKKLDVMSVSVGDTIVFRNDDSLFHNIFSLSLGHKFDLGPADSGQSKSHQFNKKGIVEIECIFHPKMFFELTVE